MKISNEAKKALGKKPTVMSYQVRAGKPGGPNNDCLKIFLSSGEIIKIDSYAMTGMTVKVIHGD